MIYSQGKTGRIFVARLEDGDHLFEGLRQMVRDENINAGIIYIIGGIKEAAVVVGPEKCTIPPDPVWRKFDDCREVIGIGTLFHDNEGEPVIHLHGALGKGDVTLMGCLRGESEIYLVAEIILLEIVDSGAVKMPDPATGLKLLDFLPE